MRLLERKRCYQDFYSVFKSRDTGRENSYFAYFQTDTPLSLTAMPLSPHYQKQENLK
jgi:hypothetical protein